MIRSALLVSVLFALSARAGQHIRNGERALEELEFEQAERHFRNALGDPATREERIQAWRGLGLALAFQGDAKTARACFEKLLLIDPEASVDASLGPRISRPFELARRAVGNKRNQLFLERSENGALTVRLAEDVPLAKELTLRAREEGQSRWQTVAAGAGQPLAMGFAPSQAVEAYAEALDAQGGVLYQVGTPQAPRRFPSLVPPAHPQPEPAVVMALEEARFPEDENRPRWPIYVGVGAVVTAGVVAGVLLAQPPPLTLPPADRTGQLPYR